MDEIKDKARENPEKALREAADFALSTHSSEIQEHLDGFNIWVVNGVEGGDTSDYQHIDYFQSGIRLQKHMESRYGYNFGRWLPGVSAKGAPPPANLVRFYANLSVAAIEGTEAIQTLSEQDSEWKGVQDSPGARSHLQGIIDALRHDAKAKKYVDTREAQKMEQEEQDQALREIEDEIDGLFI